MKNAKVDQKKIEETEKTIEKNMEIRTQIIYYVYDCGHAHGPELDIKRRYTSGSVRTYCPVCGAISCSLNTRPAKEGHCQRCQYSTSPRVLPEKLTSTINKSMAKPKKIAADFALPPGPECENKGKFLCEEESLVCIKRLGFDCLYFKSPAEGAEICLF